VVEDAVAGAKARAGDEGEDAVLGPVEEAQRLLEDDGLFLLRPPAGEP
jgi:hypothetical protein